MTVYAVHAQDTDHVKLGYTGDVNVEKRIDGMRTGCPHKLVLLVVVPDATLTFEKYLHHKFASRRGHGEWFTFYAEERARLAACLNGVHEAYATRSADLRARMAFVRERSGAPADEHAIATEMRYSAYEHQLLGPEVLGRCWTVSIHEPTTILLPPPAKLTYVHVPGHALPQPVPRPLSQQLRHVSDDYYRPGRPSNTFDDFLRRNATLSLHPDPPEST